MGLRFKVHPQKLWPGCSPPPAALPGTRPGLSHGVRRVPRCGSWEATPGGVSGIRPIAVPAVGDVGSGLESLVLGMVGVCLECDTSTAAQAGRAEDVGIVVPWVPVAHLRYRWPYRAFPYQQRLTTTTRKHGLMHQRRVSALLRAILATQRDAGCWHKPARASSKGASGAGCGAAWEH